jgi:NADH-quinone oxidoreductase subunit G
MTDATRPGPAGPRLVTLTIEGRTATVPEGTSIIEAAKTVGVLIPHYCYHPGLPVAGVCRMCLVEVEKLPKLAPACATQAMEGQVVRVHAPAALEARQGVLEFLLINHPLDCPVCDQAGECELQDYTFAEGRAESRYREAKRFNPVEDFGGDVLYVPNRCILCTRCVRFMSDVAREPVLNVSERGDRAFIGKADGHDLTSPWAGNVVDLCPVGALLSKDFLNRARAWELDRAPSVCGGCSQGCNVVVETRDNVVVRIRPRPNEAVNGWFMCEVGRQRHRAFNRRDRLDQPLLRDGDALRATDWDAALAAAARLLDGGRVTVLASAGLSNESLFLLGRIAARRGGRGWYRVPRGDEAPLPGVPDLALRAERVANATGAAWLGFREADTLAAVLADAEALLVADDPCDGVAEAAAWREALPPGVPVVHLGTALPAALAGHVAVALPIANLVEEEGTLTNLRGRVQRFLQARAAPGLTRPSWFVLADLVAALGGEERFLLPSEVFAALAATHAPFAGLDYDALGLHGAIGGGAGATAPATPVAGGSAG